VARSEEEPLAFYKVIPVGPRARSFGTGRTCAVDGCSTPLSRYNPDDRCSAHDEASSVAAVWAVDTDWI
jgi:hypothetical protein